METARSKASTTSKSSDSLDEISLLTKTIAKNPWLNRKYVFFCFAVVVSFKILASSSSGNAGLLQTSDSTILLDAGLSGRKLAALLAEEGIKPGDLDAIFLTHEHADHTAGIRGLSKQADVPVYANRDTAQAVQASLKNRPSWKIFETGEPFTFKNLRVHPFSVPHDAYDPVGFHLEWGGEDLFNPPGSLAWVTDLGHAPRLVREKIAGAAILVIEANHCSEMLERDTKRPWSLKQRISGRHGHLSNHATLELLNSIENPRWQEIYLMHLSKDCNDVDLVRSSFSGLRGKGRSPATFVVDPNTSEAIPA